MYFALALYLARGVTFTVDELTYFGESSGFGPSALADPLEGHLTATTRFVYQLSLELFGPEHLPLQIFTAVSVVGVAALLFVLTRRWVGAPVALGAAVLMLFLGSTPGVLQGNATMWVHSTFFGLAAFAAFDRDSRPGDLVACAMLVFAVLSLETGLAFSMGIGVWALLRDGRRRIWVAAVPLLVYLAWWLWATKFDEGIVTVSNVLLIPAYTMNLLAAASSAMTGLGIDFTSPTLATVDDQWGVVLVPLLVMVGLWGTRQPGTRDPALWGVLTFIALFSISCAMAYGLARRPDSSRYLYPLIVGMLVALAACWRGRPATPTAAAGVLGLVALALLPNLWLLRERGAELRALSEMTEATLTAIELEREAVAPGFTVDIRVPVGAADYLSSVDEFGSPAPSPQVIADGSMDARAAADETLGQILSPSVVPVPDDLVAQCNTKPAPQVELQPGPNVLRSSTGGSLLLGRFAEPSIEAGAMPARTPVLLMLPQKDAGQPWAASVPGAELETCQAAPEDQQ